jgi:hypothetical protein
MKKVISLVCLLLLVTTVCLAASVEKSITVWTCDSCGRSVERLRGTFPDGWIEIAGGFTSEMKSYYTSYDSWTLNLDGTRNGNQEVAYEQITIERLHFCENCRQASRAQRTLGERLLRQGYYKTPIRKEKSPYDEITDLTHDCVTTDVLTYDNSTAIHSPDGFTDTIRWVPPGTEIPNGASIPPTLVLPRAAGGEADTGTGK